VRFAFKNLVFTAAVLWMGGSGAGYANVAPQGACDAAGRAAEQAGALPANMLVSIGLVESGRIDPATGEVTPWPWTVNVDGAGHYFQNEQDAAAFVRLAESSGAEDIDVGCFQISLENHPAAFSSLDLAFDPVANANFAARFLNQLKMQNGSWNLAIADYHSGLPALGLPYQRLVLNAWRGIGDVPSGLGELGFAPADPVVILEGPAARLVRVITTDEAWGPPLMAKLPRVITP
jgi:hypothetical protein